MLDIIVIGGGMAGMTAALYALRNNKKVLVLEREAVGGQIAKSPKVENYPTVKEISGTELADQLFEQVLSLGAQFELENVLKIEKRENIFSVTTDYHTYQAKSVIIAVGVKPRTLGLEKEEQFIGNGVYYCAICDGPFFAGREVTLIGDGNSALQYALLLAGYCSKVKMVTLFDKFFGEKSMQEAVLKTENIEIQRDLKAIKLLGTEKFEGIVFEGKDKKQIIHNTDAVFVAIGQIPDNKVFAELVDIDSYGYIVADERCVTKTPGLFVAGDCRTKAVRQVTTAVGDGAIAATNACRYLNTLEG